VLLFGALFTSGSARIKEIYTVLGYEAGVSHFLPPADGSGSATT
jgi:hypothetical protein